MFSHQPTSKTSELSYAEPDTKLPITLDLVAEYLIRNIKIQKVEPRKKDVFSSDSRPAVKIIDYLGQLQLIIKASFTKEISIHYTYSLIYLNKYLMNSKQTLNEYNVHRLFATALLLAQKFLNDKVFSNKDVARAVGISLDRFNRCELSFLKVIHFETHPSVEEYNQYYQNLLQFKSTIESEECKKNDDYQAFEPSQCP